FAVSAAAAVRRVSYSSFCFSSVASCSAFGIVAAHPESRKAKIASFTGWLYHGARCATSEAMRARFMILVAVALAGCSKGCALTQQNTGAIPHVPKVVDMHMHISPTE